MSGQPLAFILDMTNGVEILAEILGCVAVGGKVEDFKYCENLTFLLPLIIYRGLIKCNNFRFYFVNINIRAKTSNKGSVINQLPKSTFLRQKFETLVLLWF